MSFKVLVYLSHTQSYRVQSVVKCRYGQCKKNKIKDDT